MQKPIWDITDAPTEENIAVILADLERCTEVPLQAVDALRSYIAVLQGQITELAATSKALRSGKGFPRVGSKLLTVDVSQDGRGEGHYYKNQPVIVQTWACQECGKTWTRETLPGNPPKYCPPDEEGKPSACYRKARRKITAKSRAKKASAQTGHDV